MACGYHFCSVLRNTQRFLFLWEKADQPHLNQLFYGSLRPRSASNINQGTPWRWLLRANTLRGGRTLVVSVRKAFHHRLRNDSSMDFNHLLCRHSKTPIGIYSRQYHPAQFLKLGKRCGNTQLLLKQVV